jgi:putative ABC transport system permease protein
MTIPLLRGRRFDARDTEGAPRVAIVDERLGRALWVDRDPIGQRIYLPVDDNDARTMSEAARFFTVVGVVRAVRLEDLAGDRPTLGAFYYPYLQGRVPPAFMAQAIKFAVKTTMSVETTERALRVELAKLDPGTPLYDIRSMDEWTDRSLSVRRSALTLTVGFGVIATCLAVLGIYGVLAYLVTQRSREFGIRIALGGMTHDIVRLILREGLVLSGAGLVIGMAGNLALAGAIRAQLFDVRPLEPAILVIVAAMICAVALAACAAPARRASRVDPAIVLAQE